MSGSPTGSRLGFDEAGSGPLLILVHAFPLDRRMWRGQLQGLSDLRRVVAVDLRGRGRSAGLGDGAWGLDDHADDLAATVESLGETQADFAGVSMGGYILFALWRRHPECIRSLALIDTRAQDDPPEGKANRERVAALAKEHGSSALVDEQLPKLLGPAPGGQVQALVREMIEQTPGATAAADSLAMRDRPDSVMDLTSVDVPALVIHGVDDAIVPLPQAELMAELIPGAHFAPIPAAGHLAPLENPEAVNLALRELLLREET
ncbi:MAG: alpha/beta fold hydrolase [Actinomycetota bacterium]